MQLLPPLHSPLFTPTSTFRHFSPHSLLYNSQLIIQSTARTEPSVSYLITHSSLPSTLRRPNAHLTTKDPQRGSPGNGRNIWNYEQRVCLDILWNLPNTPSPNERARAFNTIFKDHQLACGVPNGLTSNTLHSQYGERKKTNNSSWASNWGRVCAIPKLDDVLRAELRHRIDQVMIDDNTIQVSTGPATPPVTPPERSEVTRFSSGASSSARKRPSVVPTRFRGDQLVTPGPSTRKRPATSLPTPNVFDDNEEDEYFEPGPKRARKAQSPVVELPATPLESITLVRPSANVSKKSGKSSKKPRPGAVCPFVRPDGWLIMLKPEEYSQTQQPLNIVSEEVTHPNTGPTLVFRYWDDKSHGL